MEYREIKNEDGLTEREFIKSYNPNKYDRPSVTNDVLIFTIEDLAKESTRTLSKKKLQVLLIQRKNHPHIHKWAIPGGFVEMNEDLIDGAYRELQEETGISDVYVEQLYTFGDLYLDKNKTIPRDPRTRIITVANIALISKEKMKPVAGDDAKDVMWFDVKKVLIDKRVEEKHIIKTHSLELLSEDGKIKICYKIQERTTKNSLREKESEYTLLECSTDALAFDHYRMLDTAIDTIRNKVVYTPIAINLLPRVFTVAELKQVYEAVFGREILDLERKVGDMIIKTDEKLKGKPHNETQLYKFNEQWDYEF